MKELARDDVFNNYVVSMMVNKIGNNYGLVVQNNLSCITCIVQDIVPKNICRFELAYIKFFHNQCLFYSKDYALALSIVRYRSRPSPTL